MEPKQIFSIVVMVMLSFEGVHSRPGNWSIRSFYREEEGNCGENAIRIQCSNPTAKYCEAKCDGSDTKDSQTRFKIKGIGNKVCIEFSGTVCKYALKVVHSQNKTRFERQQCSNATREFLFEETKYHSPVRYSYKHTAENGTQTFLSCSCDNKYVSLQKDPDSRRSKFFLNREDKQPGS